MKNLLLTLTILTFAFLSCASGTEPVINEIIDNSLTPPKQVEDDSCHWTDPGTGISWHATELCECAPAEVKIMITKVVPVIDFVVYVNDIPMIMATTQPGQDYSGTMNLCFESPEMLYYVINFNGSGYAVGDNWITTLQ